MWPGQQKPDGDQSGQNPGQNPYGQPVPGQQGAQTGPYGPGVFGQPWQGANATPGTHQQYPSGAPAPAPGPAPRSAARRKTVVAISVTVAVGVAVGMTAAFLFRDGDRADGDRADGGRADGAGGPASPAPASGSPSGSPSASVSSGAPGTVKPTVKGWKVVVNPAHGTAFDVPPDWEVLEPQIFSGFSDDKDPDKPVIGHTAPAFFKKKWCSLDANGDGYINDIALASTGTKGASGAKTTDEIAEKTATAWAYSAFASADKKVVKWDKPVAYTTKAGVKGSYVKARTEGAKKDHKCAGDGWAIAFGFKNSKGDFVAWDFYGRSGVQGAVRDDLVMRILSTVRLSGAPAPDPLPKETSPSSP